MANHHSLLLWALSAHFITALAAFLSPRERFVAYNGTTLQDVVTWDEYSVMVRGERLIFFSGEVHPFRLPSPGLWLDIFQKIRAMGFTGASFYVMWGLLEGTPGTVRSEGVFALEEFFRAATEAGIYLLARPGPYVNAEVSGGGFPGWLQRTQGAIRTSAPDFLEAITPYLATIGGILEKAQITNGGPIVLVQPENEYTYCADWTSPADISACLDKSYMAFVESQLREAGVVVPFISNDAFPVGNFAPGSGTGEVDIYGVDDYPFPWGSGCAQPSNWSRGSFPLNRLTYAKHKQMSPGGPFAIPEFQGGQADPWGGSGVDACAALVNHEFSRVMNKALYSVRATIFNIYMIFGGTNWGNLGHPGGYSSYDVGAAIKENREVTREAFSEVKLQAHFMLSSPSFALTKPMNETSGVYTDSVALLVTPLVGPQTSYYVVRHADYRTEDRVTYKLRLRAGDADLTLPQLGGELSLSGRDSKIHIVNYTVGDIELTYSTAEVFTARYLGAKTLIVLYGGAGETHEIGLPHEVGCPVVESSHQVDCQRVGSLTVIQWDVIESRQILFFGTSVEIHLLWRNDAFNYWSLDLPEPAPVGRYPSVGRLSRANSSVILRAGYLMRSASLSGKTLYLTGDVNKTTEIEVIAAPVTPEKLFFNGNEVQIIGSGKSGIKARIPFDPPEVAMPNLSHIEWQYLDTLPEIQPGYNDSSWTSCDFSYSNNTRNITTPTSLYASDYGYHSGSLLYRGHFVAAGNESKLNITTQGGKAFGHSIWLNSSFLGSWAGDPANTSYSSILDFSSRIQQGEHYTITVLIDHMGLRDNWEADLQGMREPRGILHYDFLQVPSQPSISWKMTGNFGGESYQDLSRGPLNEGAFFAERRGYHLPGAPTSSWSKRTPMQGLEQAGAGFFTTEFDLQMPESYDTPISLVVGNGTSGQAPVRLQFFINGWQVGKYISNIGPQSRFVLPEGLLNHNGKNYLAITLWSLDSTGGRVGNLSLEIDNVIYSGYRKPSLVEAQKYTARAAM